ncbi:MAG: hypothetical protein LBK94_11900 [Prevotellaceae bacterium]|jgi:hypothetical protein|nr:hypothetical protein [Prevotellaceae bacterium]
MIIQLGKDVYFAVISKIMTKEGLIDAAVNIVSAFGGGYGAGFGFLYNQYKNAGKFFIETVNTGETYLRNKFKNPSTYLWGW